MSMERAGDDEPKLGTPLGADTPFRDVPYGLLTRFSYTDGDLYFCYTSEHTDRDAVDEMWSFMPGSLSLIASEAARHAPEFKGAANSVMLHRLFSRREMISIAPISAEEFFATQVVQ